MRSMILGIAVWSLVIPLSAQEATYQRPSREVLEVLHAPLPPAALLSPDRRMLILAELNRYPAVAELAEPMLRLAGLRINPRKNGPHSTGYIKSLRLRGLESAEETPIALPPGSRAGAPQWNATSTQFACCGLL
jgi:hypothetical protein